MSARAADHHVDDRDANVNSCWDNALPPVATVAPGEVVRFDCRDTLDGQVGPESTAADLEQIDRDVVHPLTGPVAIEGATPGDALLVELLAVEHHGHGHTSVLPGELGLGLLADEFPDPAYHHWSLEGDVGHFVDGIEVPLDPFPGILGVAPDEPGRHSTSPPRAVGGNLDVKHLTAGAEVALPVAVEGGLFAIGDGHAAQGDGEVCGTGIEAPLSITCRFDVERGVAPPTPQYRTTGPATAPAADRPTFATTGVAEDLRTAARDAVRAMIDHLGAEHGLDRPRAYMLCSTAVDLKCSEVVNPNVVVSAHLPLEVIP